jgi:YbgC/YbaW family acyl-CoA thioester hydrolase
MKQNIVERRIMWGDLDSLGIVFYPRYYEWIDACGHLFFDSINLNLVTLWEKRHILFGLTETSCVYSTPGRYHQTLRIVTQIEELGKKALKLKHTILDAASGGLIAAGFEKRVCMDVTNPKDIRAMNMPEDIYAILKTAIDDDLGQ